MFHKIFNILSAVIFIGLGIFLYVTENIGTSLYSSLVLKSVFLYFLLYLLINAIRRETPLVLFLLPFVSAVTAIGILNLSIMTCYSVDMVKLGFDTSDYTKVIKSMASTYKELFEDEEHMYYADRDFENLIQVSKTDSTFMITYPIQKNDDTTQKLSNFSPFYDIANIGQFKKTCSYELHFAMVNGEQDNSVLLRIVNEDNIYYSYIILSDVKSFFDNSDAFEYLYTEGGVSLYVSKVSVTANLDDMKNKDEVEVTQNSTFLVSVTDSYYVCGDAMYVDYETTPDYVTRINTFLNKGLIDEIKRYEGLLETADEIDAEMYEEEIALLNSQMTNTYVELINEVLIDTGEESPDALRFYRTYTPTMQEGSEAPDTDVVSIVEWYVDGTYLIGYTYFGSSEMFPVDLFE